MTKQNHKSGVGVLISMLENRRPHRVVGSESRFAFRYLGPIGASPDKAGNFILRVGDSPVLWSSHLDTVHRIPGRQRIAVTPDGVIKLARKEQASNCLGADCTAGVWLMREMALAGVPGLYIWHAGEETGGIGSSYIAHHTPEVLDGIKAAIAFDRRGTKSVITHQSGGRCCSDAFAESFAKAAGLPLFTDTGGTFTDTANYTDLIGECTNVSVGYAGEHSAFESLDSKFLIELSAAMCHGFDAGALEFNRMAGERDSYYAPYARNYWGKGESVRAAPRPFSLTNGNGKALAPRNPAWDSLYDDDDSQSYRGRRVYDSEIDTVAELLELNPQEAARVIVNVYGFSASDFADEIYEAGGTIPGRMLDAAAREFEDDSWR